MLPAAPSAKGCTGVRWSRPRKPKKLTPVWSRVRLNRLGASVLEGLKKSTKERIVAMGRSRSVSAVTTSASRAPEGPRTPISFTRGSALSQGTLVDTPEYSTRGSSLKTLMPCVTWPW